MIKIGLVDDHSAIRMGVKQLLEKESNLKVVLEANDGVDFFKQLRFRGDIPQVIVMDVIMPNMNGMTLIDLIREHFPSIKVIVFSFLSDENTIRHMIHKGARAFLTKGSNTNLLLEAINEVATSGKYFGDTVRQDFFERPPINYKLGFHGTSHLTENEIAFIKYAATGLTYKEIAARIGKTEKAIENYRDNLFKKLKISNRSTLIVYGFLTGLLDTVNLTFID